MKIQNGAYPLTQLLNGRTCKTAPGLMKGVSADTKDAGAISAVTGKAVIRCLNTIETMTSEIMDIVDRNVDLSGKSVTGNEGVISVQTLQFRPVVPGDVLIVVPDRIDTGTGRGSLLIAKNALPETAGDSAGTPEEEIGRLSKDIVDWFNRSGRGILRAPRMDPMDPAGRFIISVEDAPGASPIFAVRHRDVSGKTGTLKQGTFAERATLALVIRTLVHGSGEAGPAIPAELSSHRVPQVPGDTGGAASIARETLSVDRPESPLPLPRDFGLPGKVKVLSRLVPEMSQAPVAGRRDEETATDQSPAGAVESPASLAAEVPGFMVTVLDARTGETVSLDGADRIEVVLEKMVRLSGVIADLVSLQDTKTEAGSDEMPQTHFKEAVKRMVKDSFLGAVARPNGGALASGPGVFGITLDETGGLTIDRAVLKDALGASRDEAAGFVRGFASSLHDRVAYAFNPLAGASGGSHENVSLRGPGKDGNVAGEERNAKEDFEKRLNELQMLLKNSHELKDSFMRRKIAGQG